MGVSCLVRGLVAAGVLLALSGLAQADERDLLANLDVKRQQVAGEWKLVGGVLETPVGERLRLEFPGALPEEYDLRLEVERTQGQDAFCIGLVVDGRQTSILIDGYAGKASGLHLINNQGCDKNATSYKHTVLPMGKRVPLRVSVQRGEVSLVSGETEIFTWKGDPAQLSLWEGWKVRSNQTLFVAAHLSAFRIHSAKFRSYSGGPALTPANVAPSKTAGTPTITAKPIETAPAPGSVLEVRPAPQKGAFELARTGVSMQLHLHVLQRSNKPLYLPQIQKLQAKLEEHQRAEKLKARAGKQEEPLEPGQSPDKAQGDTKWSVYVPKEYDGVIPYGAIAFIPSVEKASVHAPYKPILDKHRLIWISPDSAGNESDTCWRMTAALDGLRRLREDLGYAIDPDRIYVSGFSGGGRVASNVGLLHSDVVTGGIYFAGVNYFREASASGGVFVPASILGMTPQLLNVARSRRHVLIYGTKDSVAGYVPSCAPMFVKDGFKSFLYLEVPDLAHSLPGPEWFDKAVVALDSPLAAAAKGNFEAGAAAAKREALGKALQGYLKAAAHGASEPFAAEARQKAAELQQQYLAAAKALEATVDAGDTKAITAEMANFRRVWDTVGAEDAKRLAEKQKAAQLKGKD